jgi:sialic acid synthase SpsE|tara:strand:- start:92 stop:349 length:258 start_codon:yes stop_codon:yes gene_type:complete
MVQAIRNVELVLGSEHKTPTQMEKKNKLVSRKSIVAKIKIKKGDIFSIENITAKRPGDGIDPMFFWELIGTSSQNSYNPDDQIHE